MKKILIVLLEKYVDWEAAYVSAGISQLAESKYCVKTVSITNKLIHSTGGLLVQPDYDLSTIPDDYVAAILVGGYTWRNEETLALKPFIQKCVDEGKLLAAICDATVFIGKMGLLNSINQIICITNSEKELRRLNTGVHMAEKEATQMVL